MPKRSKGEGSLLKRKGCQIWVAQWYRDGVQIRRSTGTAIKQKAFSKLLEFITDSKRGLPDAADLKKISYGDLRAGLIANYEEKGNRTIKVSDDGQKIINGLNQLDEFFGYAEESVDGEWKVKNPGVPVTRLHTDAGREFARKRKAEGAGPAMVNRSLALLRRMLHIAYEEERIPAVPKIRLLKEPDAREGFLPLQKFEELVGLLPTYLRPLITFLYYCGVRLGEALSIEWPQVDLQMRLIRLEGKQTKNKKPRIIPLPSVLVAMLAEIRPENGAGKVFDGYNLRAEWEKACTACGLGKREVVEGPRKMRNDRAKPREVKNAWHRYKGLIVHDLRRSAIRNLVRAGVPETVAMKISGHKTRSVFDRYNITDTEDVAAAMRLVETSSLRASRKPAIILKGHKKISGNSVAIYNLHELVPAETR